MNTEKTQTRLFSESALRLISSCFSKKEMEFNSDMGLGELELLAKDSGFGSLYQVFAFCLYELETNELKKTGQTFVMRLPDIDVRIIIDFIMYKDNYSISFEVKKLYINQNEINFDGSKKLYFKGTLHSNVYNSAGKNLVYGKGEYCE